MSKIDNSMEVNSAITKVLDEVSKTGNLKDIEYFQYHEKRFARMAISILNTTPRGAKILDVGSHYLHASMVLSELGYKMYAVDVSEFWEIDFIQSRMLDHKIEGISENDLESFASIETKKDEYDMVLFTEILEHITFNPITFWKRVYSSMKSGGLIYITTPNSLALPSLIRSFGNLILFRGIGIKISDIFSYVTYGHHWKEYSRGEIRKYFQVLSDDFKVNSKPFSFHKRSKGGFRNWVWESLIVLGHWTYFFSPGIESLVKLEKRDGFKLDTPEYH